jgi:predicted ribosome quality control (RQC) complex YloA/Tae2 family protein
MGFGDPNASDADRRVDEAKKKLEPEVRWAEQELDKLRKKAAERAQGQLSQRGDDEEKMAQRAGQIKDKGQGQGALPQPALEALDGAERSAHEAARQLKQGSADKALDLQREAQRQLEQAREALGQQSEQDQGAEGNEAPPSLRDVDIPKADQHKGPEEFRRRVIKGLGQPAGGHKDATRRYAEGLLR